MGDQLGIFSPAGNIRSTLRPDLPPGSPQAKQAGCRCSVIANDEGRGLAGVCREDGFEGTVWAVSDLCRLHWPQGV